MTPDPVPESEGDPRELRQDAAAAARRRDTWLDDGGSGAGKSGATSTSMAAPDGGKARDAGPEGGSPANETGPDQTAGDGTPHRGESFAGLLAGEERQDDGWPAYPEALPQPVPVLFEAVSFPQRSWTPRSFAVLSGLLLTASGTTATMFLLMGAWPILGFLGLEVPLVLFLIALHHRRAGRASEWVSLTGESLRIRRTDPAGRRESYELQPYWTRVDLREDPATAGVLRLRCRGRSVEVGRWLAQSEKKDFAEALREALHRYREPRFDNPQLRNGTAPL